MYGQIVKFFVLLFLYNFVNSLQDGEENCETLPSEIHLIKGKSDDIRFYVILFNFFAFPFC